MRCFGIQAVASWLFLTVIYQSKADDDREGDYRFHYGADKNIRQWILEEDEVFYDSGVCGVQNLSYVKTCDSEKTVDSLNALSRTNCFCDKECYKYGDCCINRPTESYFTLPWRCREVREGRQLNTPIYVFQSCPEVWGDTSIRTMCEEEAEDLEKEGRSFSYLQDIPVKSKVSGIFYRNVYCALCNYESELVNWNSMVYCAGMNNVILDGLADNRLNFSQSVYNTRTKSFRKVLVEGRMTNCRLVIHDFKLNTLLRVHQARLCKSFISSCSDNADAVSWQKCNSYASFVYATDFPKRKVYKNFHCALCNNVAVERINCSDPLGVLVHSNGTTEAPAPGTVLNFLFDFNYEGGNNQIGVATSCKLSEGLIWDSLLKKCYSFTCGSLFIKQGSKCIPRVTNNVNSGLNDSCLKKVLERNEFIMQNNGSVVIKHSGQVLLVNQYEINKKNDQEVASIVVCADKGSFLLHLSSVQYWLSEITLSLSIICLLIHLFVYSVLKDLRNCPGKILMSLSACMVCAHIFLLMGQHIAHIYYICYASGVLMHFGYLSSFLWMNVMAYDIYRTFSQTQSRKSNNRMTFYKYSTYCWITAALITGLSVVFDNVISPDSSFRPKYGNPICWFNQRKGLIVFFILPVFTLLVTNVSFFVTTAFRIRKISKQTKMVKTFPDRVRYLLYVKLTVVLGLTWLLGILAGILKVAFLWYPFILLNGLQGVFIFVSFTVKRKIIKMLFIKFKIHSDSYKIGGHQSAVKRAIYCSLTNLSSLQSTSSSLLPSNGESREILRAVRKINPDSIITDKKF